MVCLAVILFFAGPRVTGLIWWVFDSDRWDDAFATIIWPLLGLIFLPWLTLAFVLVSPTGHVSLFDAFVLLLAFMLDCMMWFGGYLRRDSAPGYTRY